MAFLKKIAVIIFSIIIFIITLYSAFAIDVDANDQYLLVAGEEVKGSFLIKDFDEKTLVMSSSTSWVDLEDFDLSELTPLEQANYLSDKSIFVEYTINVPEDADVGVYRAVIELKDVDDTEYFNIKISVQKPFFKGLFANLRKMYYSPILLSLAILILLIVAIGIYLAKEGKR